MNAKLIITAALLAGALPAGAQTCLSDSIRPSTQLDQYLPKGDGTVVDARTGLMWSACALGQSFDGARCLGEATDFTWQQALAEVATLNAAEGFAGHTDWRLPNIKELSSLIERQCYNPAIRLDVFPDTPSATFLSSTPDERIDRQAREVNFADGSEIIPEVSTSRHVRLVRKP